MSGTCPFARLHSYFLTNLVSKIDIGQDNWLYSSNDIMHFEMEPEMPPTNNVGKMCWQLDCYDYLGMY